MAWLRLTASIVVVVMMVMMVVVMPVAVVMVVMVMVVILRELHPRRVARSLLLIHRPQHRAGIGYGCQQISVGIGLQHLAGRRKLCGVT